MTKLRQKLHGKLYLLLCFIIPLLAMGVVYIAHRTWPFGKDSVLVLDLNAQYVYFFEKLRQVLRGGGNLLYSFGRALGGEFTGIFAYYLSSPFSLIVALFPKNMITEAILTIVLLKCGSCGLTMGIYLHCVKGRRPALNVVFSVMYALSAYAVVMQNNLMWTDNLICLPLILLGIERIIRYGKFKTYVIFLSAALLTSFYIGYMTCIFVAFYSFVRYFTYTREERNPLGQNDVLHFLKSFLRIAFYSAVSIMIASTVILGAYYSLSFGKLSFSTPDYKPKQIYDFLPMLSKLFFGSYDTVRPEGMPLMYCGMMTPILAPLYFLAKSIPPRKKVGAGLIIVFFLLGMNFNVFDIIWHGFQRPNWLNARFSFMFVFVILVLAYDAFVRLPEIGYGKVLGCCAALALILMILQTMDLKNLPTFTAVWASLGLIALYSAVMYFTRSAADRSLTAAGTVLVVIVTAEMILSGVANIYALDKDVVFSERQSYRTFIDKYYEATSLVDDDSFYRSEKLEHRKPNDNLALGLNGLSNSTSTLNESAILLLRRLGLTSRSHWSKYVGSTAPEDVFLGVKYVYADKTKETLPRHIAFYYDEIGETDSGIAVYRNPYALSPVFTTPTTFSNIDPGDSTVTDPFRMMNEIYAGLLGDWNADPIWKKAEVSNFEYFGSRKFVAEGHDGFEKVDSDTSSRVTFTIRAADDSELYMYIPTDYPRDATVYVGGRSWGRYFTNDTHGIKELGSYEEGNEIRIDIMMEKDKMYFAQNTSYFYFFDDDAFVDTMEKLRCRSLETDSFRDDRIEGTLTVEEGMNTVMTTIPYDEGWIVTANGKQVETKRTLGALMSFELPAGEYEIVLKYRPSWLKTGAVITVTGIALFIGACVVKALLKRFRKEPERKKERDAVDTDPAVPPDDLDVPFGDNETPLPEEDAPADGVSEEAAGTEPENDTDRNPESRPADGDAEDDPTGDCEGEKEE